MPRIMQHEEPDGSPTPSGGFSDPGFKSSPSSAFDHVFTRTQIHWQKVWSEVLGILQSVDRVSGVMSFKGLLVAVPPRELETLPDIETYIGERVGLLRTDIPHRSLCLRLDKPTKRHEYDPIRGGKRSETDGEVLA